ncbi:GtrA family protein [Ihubacter sp. rT4E-8]|uniref:GtrA family protein n=1 Tax=unclassified Ihubacter TaxID=2633299 RepID=UPI00137B290D
MKKYLKSICSMELLRYVFTGGMTTVINYVLYFLMTAMSVHYLAANSLAWLGAVIFAFFANRHVVFHSDGNGRREFAEFFSLRAATLLVENLLLLVLVSYMGIGSVISKVLVSVITVALNYGACKYGIFRERGVSHE